MVILPRNHWSTAGPEISGPLFVLFSAETEFYVPKAYRDLLIKDTHCLIFSYVYYSMMFMLFLCLGIAGWRERFARRVRRYSTAGCPLC